MQEGTAKQAVIRSQPERAFLSRIWVLGKCRPAFIRRLMKRKQKPKGRDNSPGWLRWEYSHIDSRKDGKIIAAIAQWQSHSLPS
jgi:hypothetical protein